MLEIGKADRSEEKREEETNDQEPKETPEKKETPTKGERKRVFGVEEEERRRFCQGSRWRRISRLKMKKSTRPRGFRCEEN